MLRQKDHVWDQPGLHREFKILSLSLCIYSPLSKTLPLSIYIFSPLCLLLFPTTPAPPRHLQPTPSAKNCFPQSPGGCGLFLESFFIICVVPWRTQLPAFQGFFLRSSGLLTTETELRALCSAKLAFSERQCA